MHRRSANFLALIFGMIYVCNLLEGVRSTDYQRRTVASPDLYLVLLYRARALVPMAG